MRVLSRLVFVLVAASACGKAASSSGVSPAAVPCDTPAGTTTLVPPAGSFAYALVTDDTFVWFAASDGVRKVPRTGGAEVLVGVGSDAVALGLAGPSAYFFGSYTAGDGPKPSSASALFSVPLEGGPPVKVLDGAWSMVLATDGVSLFWPQGLGIARLDPPSTTPVDLAPGARLSATALAVDDAHVYVANFLSGPDGTIERIPKGGGPPQTLASNQAHPAAIAVDDAAVYWVDVGYGTGATALMRAGKDGSNVAPLVDDADGARGIGEVAVDGTNVYWLEISTGRIVKMPKAGGAETVIASGLEAPGHLVAHGGNVYWANDTQGALSVGEPNHAVMTACK
jgi:hypothetical protein